jgi:hypothetical protein
MKHLARSILIVLLAALELKAQGTATYPFSVGPPPSVPSASVTCSVTGVVGTTTYYYWVVPIYPIGMVSTPGGAPSCVITNANATLSGGNFDVISWSPVSVPSLTSINYAVLRATTPVWPGTGTTAVTASTSSTSVNDQSNSLNAFTYTATPQANAQLTYNNRDRPTPFISVTDATGLVTQNFFGGSVVESNEQVVTLAQINAGLTFIPATAYQTLKVVGYWWQVTGAFATCTDVRLSDTSGGPVDVTTIAVAGLTNGAIIDEGTTANTTLGTFAAALTANQGLQIRKTGAACTGGTSITVRVYFKVNS